MNSIQFKSLILAFRPKTLTAALVPCLAGTALAVALGKTWSGTVLFYALAASFFIQIGTNLINDSVDFKKGADTEKRIGPMRITQAGYFSARTVFNFGSLFFLLALLCGMPLVMIGGAPIIWIGIFSILMGYAYTAGPFPLAYRGLGDLFVIIFFGIIAVMGIVYLHTGEWLGEAFILGLQIGFHATVLIAINNLRDAEGDKLVHKKTLAVRFGKGFAKKEIIFMAIAPFMLNLYWMNYGFYKAIILSLLAMPLAIIISKNILNYEPGPIYNKFLAQGAALHLVFGLLLSLGFIL